LCNGTTGKKRERDQTSEDGSPVKKSKIPSTARTENYGSDYIGSEEDMNSDSETSLDEEDEEERSKDSEEVEYSEGDPDDTFKDNPEEANNFRVQQYIENDRRETPLVAYANTSKISVGFLPMSFFVHQKENFLFRQPLVNHRNVSLIEVRDKLTEAAVEEKSIGQNFDEEMSAIIYEVTYNKEESNIPICCTYQTESSEVDKPSQLQDCYAKFPTRNGILRLQSLNMQTIIDAEKLNDEAQGSEPYLPPNIVSQIFNSKIFQEMTIENKKFFADTTNSKSLSNDDILTPEYYRKVKNVFQNEHNIRFAFLGGNHRMATAVHLFGGYKVEPTKLIQHNTVVQDYNITFKMKINASPNITVIIPTAKALTDKFIEQCNITSYLVEKRKTECIQVTFASLGLDILDEEKKSKVEERRSLFDG